MNNITYKQTIAPVRQQLAQITDRLQTRLSRKDIIDLAWTRAKLDILAHVYTGSGKDSGEKRQYMISDASRFFTAVTDNATVHSWLMDYYIMRLDFFLRKLREDPHLVQ